MPETSAPETSAPPFDAPDSEDIQIATHAQSIQIMAQRAIYLVNAIESLAEDVGRTGTDDEEFGSANGTTVLSGLAHEILGSLLNLAETIECLAISKSRAACLEPA